MWLQCVGWLLLAGRSLLAQPTWTSPRAPLVSRPPSRPPATPPPPEATTPTPAPPRPPTAHARPATQGNPPLCRSQALARRGRGSSQRKSKTSWARHASTDAGWMVRAQCGCPAPSRPLPFCCPSPSHALSRPLPFHCPSPYPLQPLR